jgi:acetyl esterase/lipase
LRPKYARHLAQVGSMPALAEGLELYIELMRSTQGGRPRPLSAQRLRSDLDASDLRCPQYSETKTLTTFIVAGGHELAVRLYFPAGPTRRPAICYFHGGGFTFGSLESFDVVATGLAERTGAVVASVQYRRLPENSYRAAQEDCYTALVWLHEHAAELGVDPSRIAVAGDSVGALLATISTVMARDRGGPRLACQLLLYGAFAMRPGRSCYASSRDPLLTAQRVDGFISVYNRQQDPSFYPAPLALGDLSKLPPAIVVAAEHDPLREEALEYADRLRQFGVKVEVSVAPAMIHGFLRARKMCPAAERQLTDLAQRTREHLWLNARGEK